MQSGWHTNVLSHPMWSGLVYSVALPERLVLLDDQTGFSYIVEVLYNLGKTFQLIIHQSTLNLLLFAHFNVEQTN